MVVASAARISPLTSAAPAILPRQACKGGTSLGSRSVRGTEPGSGSRKLFRRTSRVPTVLHDSQYGGRQDSGAPSEAEAQRRTS